MKTTEVLATRFFNFVEKQENGCWLWTGSVMGNNGYGSFRVSATEGCIGAHRMSWILHFGEIPEGLMVLHHCDVKLCINPSHLFLGDKQDNAIDSYQKGRHKGKRLTRFDVIEIRKIYKEIGISQEDLGKLFGVPQVYISKIVNHKVWKHVLPNELLT
jgi:hypothetical protein